MTFGGPVAATAAAAQRFAAPDGSGSACTAQAPCALDTATSRAASGDVVVVGPGSYGSAASPLTATIRVPRGVAVQPALTGGRPRIYSSAAGSGVEVRAGGSVVGLLVVYSGTGDGLLVNGALGERMLVTSSPAARAACEDRGGPLRDSVCASSGGIAVLDSAASGGATATVRNVTALAGGPGSVGVEASGTSVGHPHLTVVNTIAQGATDALATSSGSSAGASLVLSYSNFRTSSASGHATDVTAPGSATNQTAPALLVSPATGNYHEQPGSPTIDAGTNDPANGQYDFDLDPRVIGAAPDIGADEASPAPTVVTGQAGPVEQRSARLNGTVDPHGTDTTVSFEWGTTTAYGQSVDVPFTSRSSQAVPVQAIVDGLTPGTRYHFRVVASNHAGVAYGSDETFTTTPAPASGSTGAPRLTAAHLRAALHFGRLLRLRVNRRHPVLVLGRVRDPEIRSLLVAVTTKVRLPVHARRHVRRHLASIFVGSARLVLRPGRTERIIVSLTPAGRFLVRQLRSLRLRIVVTALGAQGERVTVREPALLRVVVPRRRAKRRHR